MRRPAVLAVFILLPLLAAFVIPAHAAEAPVANLPAGTPLPGLAAPMAAHRAQYKLILDPQQGSDVIAGTGSMTYEVLDACDGWAVRQRLDMQLTGTDGHRTHLVSDYVTWEAKTGLSFRFHMRQTTDGQVVSRTDGSARLDRAGGPGEAHFTAPADETRLLPRGTLFPMAHTETILAAAAAGKRFLALPLFDGTDDDGAENSGVVIVSRRPPAPAPYPLLAALPSARIRIAFFERKPDTMLPDYEVGMRYWANGVADALNMNFGDFTMNATLTDFTPLPHKC